MKGLYKGLIKLEERLVFLGFTPDKAVIRSPLKHR